MKKNLIILGLAALTLSSCSRFKSADGGLKYNIHNDEDGQNIQEGDFIVIRGMQTTEKDSVVFSTYDTDRPTFLVCQKPQFKGDLYSGLALLSEGDSATFKINLDTLAAKTGQPKPAFAGKDTYMIFKVKVVKVIPKGKQDDKTFGDKINEFIKSDTEAAKKAEGGKIQSYIKSKELKPTATASGLNYVITKQGAGVKANAGDTVEVNYTGMFLGGKIFDTSYPDVAKKAGTFNAQRPYAPLKMAVGLGQSIPGFDEGLMLLPKGTKATLILPSVIAYGEQGNQGIPPYTPLVFEVEVVNIIPGKGVPAAPAAPAAPVK
ncbi:MAG: FKBP-type peptidyl-prolyl cis-trans isomerase [Sphingobacteriaceae bacterium]